MKKYGISLFLLIFCISIFTPGIIKAEGLTDTEGGIENNTETTEIGGEDINQPLIVGWYINPENGKLSYYNEAGQLCTGLKEVDGEVYYFTKAGYAYAGWVSYNKKLMYFGKDYKMCKGMTEVGGYSYYFKKTGNLGTIGTALTGWQTVGKYCYYFDKKSYKLKKSDKKGEFIMVDGYKVDYMGRSKTRYDVKQLVNKHTKTTMTKEEKIESMFKWLVENEWTYTRTYEHTEKDWEWYTGWTDDFAAQIMKNESGNCFRYASLFGYMVKEATGYEVRVYHGMTPSSRGRKTPHGWITVKKDGDWYAYDPDMDKFYTHRDAYYNTLYSETKKKLHLDGEYTALK